MTRILPTLTAMVAAIACGVVHGVWTDRWQLSAEPAASAARLSDVSLKLEDWVGQPIVSTSLARDNAGHLFHRYTHKRTGKTVTVFIVCDRPGPVSIHTPNVCYGAVGFEVTEPAKFTARPMPGLPSPSFWTARFSKKRASDLTDLRIFWGWNAGEGWQAADDARWAFAKFPALYKLYLIREISGGEEPLAEDPCVDLMKQLLPELQRALFSPA